MEKILFYDLETTGLNSKMCAIHQIAFGIMIDGKIVDFGEFKMAPFDGAVTEKDALELANITEEELYILDNQHDVFRRFRNIIEMHVDKFDKSDKFHLAGYNINAFDNQFLRNWFLRNNDKYFGSYFWSDSFDVMVLASHKLRKVRKCMENFKQGTVAKKLGIEVDDTRLHDARYDIELCIEIYKKSIECCWTAENIG